MDSKAYYEGLLLPEELARVAKLDTIVDLETYTLREYTKLTALQWDGGERTYSQLWGQAARVRGWAVAKGLAPGAHVGMMMRNSHLFAEIFLGLATAGYVAVIVPTTVTAAELPGLADKFDLQVLVHDAEFAAAIEEAGLASALTLADATTVHGEPVVCARDTKKNTPAAILFSAGTTGKQKGVLLSHGALMQGAYYGIFAWEKSYFQRYLLLLPLTHVFGLVRNLLTSLYTGSTLYINTNMRDMFRDLQTAKPTLLVLVPALCEMLCRFATAKGVETLGGALQYVICGGAHVPAHLIFAMDKLGIRVCPGYGLTETANLVCGNGYALNSPASVGPAYPGEELKIVDGELWVKGGHLMSGYYNDPEETITAMADGWFRTGDLARLDDEGLLFILGRIKNLIVLDNGENVSPEELETLVNELPLVQDSLVYEAMGPTGGTTLHLEVLPDAQAAAAAGVQDVPAAVMASVEELNRTLPTFKRMDKVTVRTEDFPRTPSLKIVRPKRQQA